MNDNQQLDEILKTWPEYDGVIADKYYDKVKAKQALLQWRDAEIDRKCREALEIVQDEIVAHYFDTSVGQKLDSFITERIVMSTTPPTKSGEL